MLIFHYHQLSNNNQIYITNENITVTFTEHIMLVCGYQFSAQSVETSGPNKAFMNNRVVVEIALVSVVVDSYYRGGM